jgi:hypothetical protein
MNKGLKAHLYATLLYVIVTIIIYLQFKFIGNSDNITTEVIYVLGLGFFLIQVGIGILCYLEEYYNNK